MKNMILPNEYVEDFLLFMKELPREVRISIEQSLDDYDHLERKLVLNIIKQDKLPKIKEIPVLDEHIYRRKKTLEIYKQQHGISEKLISIYRENMDKNPNIAKILINLLNQSIIQSDESIDRIENDIRDLERMLKTVIKEEGEEKKQRELDEMKELINSRLDDEDYEDDEITVNVHDPYQEQMMYERQQQRADNAHRQLEREPYRYADRVMKSQRNHMKNRPKLDIVDNWGFSNKKKRRR